jgi:uncharacterized membrane protein
MSAAEGIAIGCAVSAALTAGVLFAFSNFIMQALERLPAAAAMRAMQAINITAVNPTFMVLLFGPGVVGLLFEVPKLWQGQGASRLLVASGLYTLGVSLVTIAGNVPLNEALSRSDADAAGATDAWRAYARPWVRYNHVRSLAAVAASVLFVLAA